MKCPECGFDLNKRERCKAVVPTPWDQSKKERNCLFRAVEDGYCKRHHPTTKLVITNRRIEKLRQIIIEGQALLNAFKI